MNVLCTFVKSGVFVFPHACTAVRSSLQLPCFACISCVFPQLAYQAWVSSVKAALRERQRRQKHLRRAERRQREGKEESQKETFSRAGSVFRDVPADVTL